MLEIGTSLREARRRSGRDYDVVERETRIPARLLRLLEEERFDGFAAPYYARSFLREYADYLGLDGAVYAAELAERLPAGEEPMARMAPLTRHRSRRPRLLAVVGCLAAGAALLPWLRSSSPHHRAVERAGHPQAGRAPARARPPRPAAHRAPTARATHRRAAPVQWLTVRTGTRAWVMVQRRPGGSAVFDRTLSTRGRAGPFAGSAFLVRALPARDVWLVLDGAAHILSGDGPWLVEHGTVRAWVPTRR